MVSIQQSVADLLQQTLSPSQRKQAEAALLGLEADPSFASALLELASSVTVADTVRFSAVLYFKNWIRKKWPDAQAIAPQTRDLIKASAVTLMISLPTRLQSQMAEVVAIIADTDFPQSWPNLMNDLISKLSVDQLENNIGVLQTAHSIFKRWRHQFRSNQLFTEIKFVLEQFANPYLQFFKATDQLVDKFSGDQKTLKTLFETLLLLVKIFSSLVCQDLPEFIEDHQEEFMVLFHKYLAYDNVLLKADDDEAGPLEKVKAEICEVLEVYVKRYEEEFKQLPLFVESVWKVLTTAGLEPKYDLLTSRAIAVLTSVARLHRHKGLFENPDTLASICANIILPNMSLRDSDVELFEDDPIEYIRRDMEGSDTDTRRRSSSDLVRALLEHFAQPVTAIFGKYIDENLKKYESNTTANWRAKDTALYLMMSISAKGSASKMGVTDTNPLVQIDQIFASHILPDLQKPVDGAVHPIIKVDAIKYVLTFRNQLANAVSVTMPLLLNHLKSQNYVLYTYAAICIEKNLTTKIGGTPMCPPELIEPLAQSLLQYLFSLISRAGTTPAKLAENDYLMKTALRIIITNGSKSASFASDMVASLTQIITAVSSNPSNPKFNHYTFEALSHLIRYSLPTNPGLLSQIEGQVLPPLQTILQQDIAEFMPYVFQIMTQLLYAHSEGIPAFYGSLVAALTQPVLWESSGNIPALAGLLQAYVQKGKSALLIGQGQLPAFLGVCQKLIASRANDHFGFELLFSIFENLSTQEISSYISNLFLLLLNRLSSSKTEKFSRYFTLFLSGLFLLKKDGLLAENIIQILNSVQPNLFNNLMEHILTPSTTLINVLEERLLLVGGTMALLNDSPTVIQHQSWVNLFIGIMKNLDTPLLETKVEEDVLDQDEWGYQASFAQLESISGKQFAKRLSKNIGQDPLVTFVNLFAQLNQSKGGQLLAQLKLSPENVQIFNKQFQMVGLLL